MRLSRSRFVTASTLITPQQSTSVSLPPSPVSPLTLPTPKFLIPPPPPQPLTRRIPPLRLLPNRPLYRSRYYTHWLNTLSSDLMYLTYNHHSFWDAETQENPMVRLREWEGDVRSLIGRPEIGLDKATRVKANQESEDDQQEINWEEKFGDKIFDPYTLNRPKRRAKGNRYLQPLPSYRAPFDPHRCIPQLKTVTISIFSTDIINDDKLLSVAITQLAVITGVSFHEVKILKSKPKITSFRYRDGRWCGAKVTLSGPSAYTFLNVLFELVLPRSKNFKGFPIANETTYPRPTPDQISSTVNFGLTKEMMMLFPQIETNFDSYPRVFGAEVQVVGNARGRRAKDAMRALVSGWRGVFVRE